MLVSSVAFWLLHLTAGLADVVGNFLVGILIGTVLHVTQWLSLRIASHYVADFLVFWWRAAVSGVV